MGTANNAGALCYWYLTLQAKATGASRALLSTLNTEGAGDTHKKHMSCRFAGRFAIRHSNNTMKIRNTKLSLLPAQHDREEEEELQDLIHSDGEEEDFDDISDEDVGSKTIDSTHARLMTRVIRASANKKKQKNDIIKVRNEPGFLRKGPSTLAPLSSITSKQKEKEKRNESKLSLRELASSILKTGSSDTTKPVVKELTKLAKKKSLNVPLKKPAADLATRVANYEDVKSRVTVKWDDVVQKHKTADHLSFPLPVIQSLDDESSVAPKKSIKNEMEQKIDALLSSSENRLQDTSSLTVAEEKLLQTLSVEEAKERLHELQRTRALLSYQEAKMKRESKIKSKTFHRIKKREKLRDALKEFESLKESDPQAALEQLKQFDKSRALERASLRHRNTGKFAKQAKIRSKYDDTARAALEEQMQIHQRNLKRREYSSDEEEEVVDAVGGEGEDGETNVDDGTEVLTAGKESKEQQDDDEAFDVSETYNPWLKVTTKESLESEVVDAGKQDKESDKEVKQIKLRKSFLQNPNRDVTDGDQVDENEQDDGLVLRKRNQMDMISEAFADDDVIEEFVKEREAEVRDKDEEAKELPGWGRWAGIGAEALNKQFRNKRKSDQKQQLEKKLKILEAKKYDAKVIINADPSAAGHRVKQIPFPFKSVPDFEAGILSNPIGRTFVPETAFKVLTRPKVTTKMGTMIAPMSEDNVRRRKDKKEGGKNKKKKEKK